MRYSEKQAELLRAFKQNKLKRLNILMGSVRSGKTWVSLVLWAFWILTMPRDGVYIMVAKTVTSLKRNCLDLLETLVGRRNFQYSLTTKTAHLFGRLVYLEGVNDARSESKIRGMTLTGAYCDELTLFTEDFFTMLLSRLSVPGAKLFGTTNPDSPKHWLNLNYIERADKLDIYLQQFYIDDNPFLDPDYVNALKAEFTGVYYDRFIRGLWVIAEGVIYKMFADNPDSYIVRGPQYPDGQFYVSIDYGTVNPFSMGLWCVNGKKAVRLKEWYWDSKKQRSQMTDEEYYKKLEEFTAGYFIRMIIVDPSAASFIETIRRHAKYQVREADNDVLNGIRVTSALISSGRVQFHESCKDAIREFGLYRWDERKNSDAVIKQDDHAMDEIRYFCYTILAREFRWVDWRPINSV